ncbi:MAG: hypothetical protein LBJ76_00820 [Candidatus Accumulibacter sp.]|jgi:hypothetical protein|nr:hypothetical protein [Accumulibacter sp.]
MKLLTSSITPFAPRFITGIFPDGEEEAQCIRIAHPSRMYVTDDLIPTHNTYATEDAAKDAVFQQAADESSEIPSFAETEKAYGGKRSYQKAKSAKKTKLNYRQWIQVRTPEFKNWFGDWEAARGVRKLDKTKAANLDGVTPASDQKAVEALFKGFGPVKNTEDGRSVTFPVGMAGKIVRHKGFDVKRIAGAFDKLFANAVPMGSELEERREGHKAHPEISAYHHYVSKFEQDGQAYYVRFSVQEMTAKEGQPGRNLAHSSFVSEVAVYEQGANPESAGGRVIDPVLTEGAAPVDRKLAQWLEKGNPATVSKVVDPETGEPKVVYHGTDAEFSRFMKKYGGRSGSDDGKLGFFFTDNREVATDYAGRSMKDGSPLPSGRVMETFLRIKEPAAYDLRGTGAIGAMALKPHIRLAKKEGLDGIIFKNLKDPGGVIFGTHAPSTIIIAFAPNQIKSATGNTGEFSPKNDEIYRQDAEENGLRRAKARLLRIGKTIREGHQISNEPIDLGKTPEVLTRLGVPQLPMRIPDPKKLFQIVGKEGEGRHGIDPETLSEVPEALHHPLAVFSSRTQDNAFVIVMELKDGEGRPVVAALHANARQGRMEINRISSIYGKDSAARIFGQWAKEGLLKYLDKSKPEALQSAGLQLPMEGTTSGLPKTIAQTGNKDKGDVFNQDALPAASVDPSPSPSSPSLPFSPPVKWNYVLPDEKLAARLDSLQFDYQDRFVDMKHIIEAIRKTGKAIREEFNPYAEESTMQGRVMRRIKTFKLNEEKPIFDSLEKIGVSLQDFHTFLHARHAPERNAEMKRRNPGKAELDARIKKAEAKLQSALIEDRKDDATRIEEEIEDLKAIEAFTGTEDERAMLSGMSDEEAKSILEKWKKSEHASEMDRLGNAVDQIVRGTLDEMRLAGLETEETLIRIEGMYKHYVPLQRDLSNVLGDEALAGDGTGRSLGNVKGSSFKRATGSLRKVENIFAQLVAAREAVIVRGEKNQVMQALYGLVLDNPNPEFWMTIKPGTPAVAVRKKLRASGAEAKDIAALAGQMTVRVLDPETGTVRTVLNPYWKKLDNVTTFRLNGEDRLIVFNRTNDAALRLAQILNGSHASYKPAHDLITAIGKVTRWAGGVNTTFNPIFGITNFERDIQSALLNLSSTELGEDWGKQSYEVAKTVPASVRALWREARGKGNTGEMATYVQEFFTSGAVTGYREMFSTIEERVKAIENEMLGKGLRNMRGAKQLLDLVSDYNGSIENGTRLSVFIAARKKGLSTRRAAVIAKDITVNFNRRGAKTGPAAMLYMFFNARVQSAERTLRTLRGRHGKKIIAGMMVGAEEVKASSGLSLSFSIPEQKKQPWPSVAFTHTIPSPLFESLSMNTSNFARRGGDSEEGQTSDPRRDLKRKLEASMRLPALLQKLAEWTGYKHGSTMGNSRQQSIKCLQKCLLRERCSGPCFAFQFFAQSLPRREFQGVFGAVCDDSIKKLFALGFIIHPDTGGIPAQGTATGVFVAHAAKLSVVTSASARAYCVDLFFIGTP